MYSVKVMLSTADGPPPNGADRDFGSCFRGPCTFAQGSTDSIIANVIEAVKLFHDTYNMKCGYKEH